MTDESGRNVVEYVTYQLTTGFFRGKVLERHDGFLIVEAIGGARDGTAMWIPECHCNETT